MNSQLPPLPVPDFTSELSLRTPARYLLEEAIGSGSMATVYRAWDRERKEPCAIKLLRPGHPQAAELCRRFLAEADVIAELDHPHIVRLHDSGVMPDGAAYLAMELLEGQDLHQLLSRNGPLPMAQALAITSQVGSALHAIHSRGVVHRDIKPQNIFVRSTAAPEKLQVKVIDFGLAKFPSGISREHSDGLIIGTLEYLAPEATLGISALVDARADQWALAVVTYRMLSGALPFSLGTDPVEGLVRIRSAPVRPLRELLPAVPAHVESAIERALSKDKESRFPGIEEFIHALLRAPETPWAAPPHILQPAPTLAPNPAGPFSSPPPRGSPFRLGGFKLALAVFPLLLAGLLRLFTAPAPVAASPARGSGADASAQATRQAAAPAAPPSRPAALKAADAKRPPARNRAGERRRVSAIKTSLQTGAVRNAKKRSVLPKDTRF